MGNVLVVGASSFIGQHLIRQLINNGENITAFVRSLEKVPVDWKDRIRIVHGDITERESLAGILRDVDVVFHLAAKVHDFSQVNGNGGEHFETNVEGTRNLLDECKASPIKHFVFFSSIKAMSEESNEVLDESSPSLPETPYGESKLSAERLVEEYGRKYGFMTTSLRLPLVYGPGNKGNIYRMIKAVDCGRFIMMGKGESRRSMVFVRNVVDAALSVSGRSEADGKVFVVTDGVDYTVRELYQTIARGLGKRPIPFYIPMSIAKGLAFVGDMGSHFMKKPLPLNRGSLHKLTNSSMFSSRKIREEIGFKSRFNLYSAMDETIRWYKDTKK